MTGIGISFSALSSSSAIGHDLALDELAHAARGSAGALRFSTWHPSDLRRRFLINSLLAFLGAAVKLSIGQNAVMLSTDYAAAIGTICAIYSC